AVTSAFDISDVVLEAACASQTLGWLTAEGGCKDTSTGLIWSAPSDTSPSKSASYPADGLISWDAAVWDDTQYPKTRSQIEIDLGITNDYAEGTTQHMTDANSLAYCQELNESGYDDWLLPTLADFNQATADGANTTLK